MIPREEVIKGYMINEKHVIAEMLYDTITKYEERIKDLEDQLTNTEQTTVPLSTHEWSAAHVYVAGERVMLNGSECIIGPFGSSVEDNTTPLKDKQ